MRNYGIDPSEFNTYDTDDTDLEDTVFDTLSLDIMTDNINSQINCEIDSNTDFIEIVFGKFNMILENRMNYDDDDVQDLKIQINDFCHDIISRISDKYNLICNFNYMDESLSYMTVLESLYNFFVLDKYSNVENFLIQYISSNSESLAEELNISPDDVEDITTASNKQRQLDPNIITVLSHIEDTLDLIRNAYDIDTLTFIDAVDDGGVHVSNIREYIESGELMGDFIRPLLNDVITDYSDYSSTKIRANIRTALMTNN